VDHQQTEPASPRKLRRARAQGRVWWSRELTGATLLCAAVALLLFHGPAVVERARLFTLTLLRQALAPSPPPPSMALDAAISLIITSTAPLLALLFVVALAVSLIQVGPIFTLAPLRPDERSRTGVVEELRRALGPRSVTDGLLILARICFLLSLLGWTLWTELRGLLSLPLMGVGQGLSTLGAILWAMTWKTLLVLLALAALDVLIQRQRFLRSQKMSRREVLQEQRESEGDPSLRGERRRLRRALLEGASVDRASRAAVIVESGDGLVVALRYTPGVDDVPLVVARGEAAMARRIIMTGRRQGVPILRDDELARGLRAVDGPIPEAYFDAVGALLRSVMDQRSSDG
jgi:flagellar biosynthesis protein FlhB